MTRMCKSPRLAVFLILGLASMMLALLFPATSYASDDEYLNDPLVQAIRQCTSYSDRQNAQIADWLGNNGWSEVSREQVGVMVRLFSEAFAQRRYASKPEERDPKTELANALEAFGKRLEAASSESDPAPEDDRYLLHDSGHFALWTETVGVTATATSTNVIAEFQQCSIAFTAGGKDSIFFRLLEDAMRQAPEPVSPFDSFSPDGLRLSRSLSAAWSEDRPLSVAANKLIGNPGKQGSLYAVVIEDAVRRVFDAPPTAYGSILVIDFD